MLPSTRMLLKTSPFATSSRTDIPPLALDEASVDVFVVFDGHDLEEAHRVAVLVEVDGATDALVVDIRGAATLGEDRVGILKCADLLTRGSGDLPNRVLKGRTG